MMVGQHTKAAALAAAALLFGTVAVAAPSGVDGVAMPGEYRHGVSVPGSTGGTGFRVHLNSSEAGFVRGALVADPAADMLPGGLTATLWFDLDFSTRPGADIGFVLFSGYQAAFVPDGRTGIRLPRVSLAISADNRTLEFAIPVEYLAFPVAGLTYDPALSFPRHSEGVRLNEVEAFGLTADGMENGSSRLGIAGLALDGDGSVSVVVPEPASAALVAVGLLGLQALRRRQRPA